MFRQISYAALPKCELVDLFGLYPLNLFGAVGQGKATLDAREYDFVGEVRRFGGFVVALESKFSPAISTADGERYHSPMFHSSSIIKLL